MKFSELELTEKQEAFVDKNMYEWGAWIRSGRLNKTELNIIAKLMQSAIPSRQSEPMCDDDTGLMISQQIENFFIQYDKQTHYIIFSFYVHKNTVNHIAVKLQERVGEVKMQPCAGKPELRIPSLDTYRRKVKKELRVAKAIIHEMLVSGFVLLRTGSENAKNIKIRR